MTGLTLSLLSLLPSGGLPQDRVVYASEVTAIERNFEGKLLLYWDERKQLVLRTKLSVVLAMNDNGRILFDAGNYGYIRFSRPRNLRIYVQKGNKAFYRIQVEE